MNEPFLEELSEAECWELVDAVSVGRVAVNGIDEGPHVVPVNYVVDGGAVVFHSDLGTKLTGVEEQVMSFQVDQIDPLHRTGWSVLIRGTATSLRRTDGPEESFESWAGELIYLVRLVAVQISGRRISLPDIELDARGYL